MGWVDAANTVAQSITALAAAAAAVIALKGVNAWHRAAVGGSRVELAEHVLADFYRARDLMKWVRTPVGLTGEGQSRDQELGEDEGRKQHLDTLYIPIERLNKEAEFFSEMRARRYRVISMFGEEASKPFDLVEEVRGEVISTARVLAMMADDPPSGKIEKRRKLWSHGDDELGQKMDEAVRLTESVFRPHIESGAAGTRAR